MATHTLTFEIEYDPSVTDPDSVGDAVDMLLETALSTPGVLDECGNPDIYQTYTDSHELLQAAREFANLVKRWKAGEYEHSDSTYMDEMEQLQEAMVAAALKKHGVE